MVAFDQLPIELYQLIFGYLDLVEVSTCRLVSKKLNEIVKVFRVRELSFYDQETDRKAFWFYDGQPIYLCHSLSNSKLAVLSTESIDLQYLKRLRLCIGCDELDPEVVNKFEQIVYLEFHFQASAKLSKEAAHNRPKTKKLKLNNLKHLHIDFESTVSIEFDAPNLETVGLLYNRIREVNEPTATIQFVAPSTVKKLYTFGLFQDQLPNFGDLKHLQYDQLDLDLDALLKAFPFLDVLNFVPDVVPIFGGCNAALTRIMRKKDQLRPLLKVHYLGFLLSDSNPVESYAFDKESELAVLIKHHSSLVLGSNIRELDYTELMSLTKNGYPIGFLESQPFVRIYSVSVKGVIDDPNRLLNVLLNCVNLERLLLYKCSLTMDFFDKLPAFTSLQQLDIYAENRDLQLDFSRFLLRITNLIEFETNQNLDAGLLRDLLQKLKYVYDLKFKTNGQWFWIFKWPTGEYRLENYCKDGKWKLIKEVACKNLIEQLIEPLNEPLNEPTSDSSLDNLQ